MTDPTVQTTVSNRLVDADTQDTHLYDPSMHDNQIVALYDTRAEAEAAQAKLVAAGIDRGAVQVMDRDADKMAGGVDYEAGDQGLWGSIKSLFMPDEDAHAYSHAIRAGHAMVVVSPNQTSDRTHIIEVLESTHPIDFDAKLAEWRQGGYEYDDANATAAVASIPAVTPAQASKPATGSTTVAGTAPRAAAMTAETATNRTATTGDDTIKVMEERLRVGKREVAAGAVRIRSYVVERPVEEQVRLHEERVTIERRPVDREATAADTAAFGERTIEAQATREEAVVSKEARVVEEIGLHKDATDRTETVKDTVRSTKVDIEDGTKASGTATGKGVAGDTGGTSSGTLGTGGATTNPTAGATSSGMNAPRK